MKPTFKLDAHPRRPRPLLSEPPAGYFDQLPMRVMARLPQADARSMAAGPGWLAWLSPQMRTSLASVAVLSGFATAFFLSAPGQSGSGDRALSLDAVPRTELVGYLLTNEARLESTDLSVLSAADPGLTKSFLQASSAELTEALDALPSEEHSYQ